MTSSNKNNSRRPARRDYVNDNDLAYLSKASAYPNNSSNHRPTPIQLNPYDASFNSASTPALPNDAQPILIHPKFGVPHETQDIVQSVISRLDHDDVAVPRRRYPIVSNVSAGVQEPRELTTIEKLKNAAVDSAKNFSGGIAIICGLVLLAIAIWFLTAGRKDGRATEWRF